MKKLVLVSLLIMVFAGSVWAEDTEDKYPMLDISGISYFYYVHDLSEGADYNAFEVSRGYLNFNITLGEKIKFRITPDFKRTSDKGIHTILKYAYIEFIDPIGANFNIRIGQNPTAWEGYMTKWWGYRWINRMASGTHGMTTSSDIGISMVGSMADKMISYQVSYRNGEGFYGYPESDSAKALEAVVDIQPVKSLPLHLFGHAKMSQITSEFDSANNLYAAALYYKDKKLRFGAEYNINELEGFSKTVMSFMSAFKFDNMTLLARYDIFDPDDSIDGNCINLIIVGVGHKISKLVQVMVDVQYKLYESEFYDDDIKLYVHWEVKF